LSIDCPGADLSTAKRGRNRAAPWWTGTSRVWLVYFPVSLGSLIGTCGEELMTLGLPSKWAWPRISDSKSRKNFSASMAQPR
jgi:hypothetical protein